MAWIKNVTFLDENASESCSFETTENSVIQGLICAYDTVRTGGTADLAIEENRNGITRVTITYPNRKILDYVKKEAK